jgi:hypothetical protein
MRRLSLCHSISRRFFGLSTRAKTAIDNPPPRALPASSPPFEAPESLVRLHGLLIKNTQTGHESARDLPFFCGSTVGHLRVMTIAVAMIPALRSTFLPIPAGGFSRR